MLVQCEICPKACVIAPGQSGECRIRVNVDGTLTAVTYAHPCAVHVDPIEKKPLYHFRPGTLSLSLATVGCNLHCLNCQNWEISQQDPESAPAASLLEPGSVPPLALENGCASVSYTYTDPVVYYEYALDAARAAREAGLANVLVTAGYVNAVPWRELCATVDAVRIDLKACSDAFYRDVCDARLEPVLDTLVLTRSLGVWLEVVNLVIPTLNDDDALLGDLARWMVRELGPDVPLHFLRFYPHYRMEALPPTPAATLERARSIARAEGLHHVYVGNVTVPEGSDTRCPRCARVLVVRRGYRVLENQLAATGTCPGCGEEVAGRWR